MTQIFNTYNTDHDQKTLNTSAFNLTVEFSDPSGIDTKKIKENIIFYLTQQKNFLDKNYSAYCSTQSDTKIIKAKVLPTNKELSDGLSPVHFQAKAGPNTPTASYFLVAIVPHESPEQSVIVKINAKNYNTSTLSKPIVGTTSASLVEKTNSSLQFTQATEEGVVHDWEAFQFSISNVDKLERNLGENFHELTGQVGVLKSWIAAFSEKLQLSSSITQKNSTLEVRVSKL